MGIPAIPHLGSRSLKPRLPSARPASLTVSEGLYHRYGLHSHICRTAGHRVINTHPSQSTDVAFVVHFRHSYYRKMGAVQHLQVPCVTWCMSCSLAHYQYCTVTVSIMGDGQQVHLRPDSRACISAHTYYEVAKAKGAAE